MTNRSTAPLNPGQRYFPVDKKKVVHGSFGSMKGQYYATFCGERLKRTSTLSKEEIITCLECLAHPPR